MLNLLEPIRRHDVDRLVFSSTAVFGSPVSELKVPLNPYGASKLMVVRILADATQACGLRLMALHYYNAAGVTSDARFARRTPARPT